MIRNFWNDIRGSYALATALAMLPLMGGLALAVDYAEMSRQKQVVLEALDAAGIATARQLVSGASDAAVIAYAKDFFEANLGSVNPADTELSVSLPSNSAGGGSLRLTARLNYHPIFLPGFRRLLDQPEPGDIALSAGTQIRLKNTLEVALVLDNSGSMDTIGSGSGQKRIDLLKAAAKQLVDTLALQAAMIKQVEKPVQFALVPFTASVNVGPQNAAASWMDGEGISPIHHENFNWAALNAPDKYAQRVGGRWVKRGTGWGETENEALTRFSLFADMRKVTSREFVDTSRVWVCDQTRKGRCQSGHWEVNGYYEETYGPFADWQGCVEARPYPYNVNDAPPSAGVNDAGVVTGDPATLFVPMFAPDEPGNVWKLDPNNANEPSPANYGASNNWWNDDPASASHPARQRDMTKYFVTRPLHAPAPTRGSGPNYSCTANPITPLLDVSQPDGIAAIKAAIDRMAAGGGTNVPEGLAWGWRAVSSVEPFTQGRPESERGNDKIVIVLTDGENTYYTPGSLGYSDPAGNKATYSSYGYMKPGYDGTSTARLFMGTSSAVGQFDYSNANYTSALNEQMATLCANAKAAKIMVMTVGLDLNAGDAEQGKAIQALKSCASDSRFRKDPADPSKPAKLFWNATGGDLSAKFKEIADELSNLRIAS